MDDQITKMISCGFVSSALCTSHLFPSCFTYWPLNIFHILIFPQHTWGQMNTWQYFLHHKNLKLPSVFPKFPQRYRLFAASSERSTEQPWFSQWRHSDPSANQERGKLGSLFFPQYVGIWHPSKLDDTGAEIQELWERSQHTDWWHRINFILKHW